MSQRNRVVVEVIRCYKGWFRTREKVVDTSQLLSVAKNGHFEFKDAVTNTNIHSTMEYLATKLHNKIAHTKRVDSLLGDYPPKTLG